MDAAADVRPVFEESLQISVVPATARCRSGSLRMSQSNVCKVTSDVIHSDGTLLN